MRNFSFSEALTFFREKELGWYLSIVNFATKNDVLNALSGKVNNKLETLACFLSKAASSMLNELREEAAFLTNQRFGKVKRIFIPLYLSNECYNICTYCGFSLDVLMDRKTLTLEEVLREVKILKELGHDNILLVSGEAPDKVNPNYLKCIIKEIRDVFSFISIEIQPLDVDEYRFLREVGIDGVVVYQETYNKEVYEKVHLKGRKRNYKWRLECPQRAASAQIYKIGLGILVGLADVIEDALYLGYHISFMKKNFWRSVYSVSFPRLRPCARNSFINHTINDKLYEQLIIAFRLWDSDLDIVLSTREKPTFRDHLLDCGVTTLSAGSSTEPGGYSNSGHNLPQFEIEDCRSLFEIIKVIESKGYEPVFKDWDYVLSVVPA